MSSKYAVGLDFGTNSVRALLVDVNNGDEIATSVYMYPSGSAGILLDPDDPNVARQNPMDYVIGTETVVREALKEAQGRDSFDPADVIGIGVDTTGSTPIPVDEKGTPLAFLERYRGNPAAMAWLWKDHTGHEEARRITELATEIRPEHPELASGGTGVLLRFLHWPVPTAGMLRTRSCGTGTVCDQYSARKPG
ncbi:hypothetical protein HQ520_18980 [bacterium]|nr:hypothetical protein [bacterium]